MLISLVTLISTLIFLKGAESALLESVKQCVPTATVRGPCHVCVCSPEGVFHCRPQKCQSENMGRSRPKEDCEPNYVFRQNNTFCTCDKYGFWQSDNCEEKFNYLHPRIHVPNLNLRTNIACIANNLYLIDCNVCRCSVNNVIDVELCTKRYCPQGHKADSCTYGDILRIDDQICSCSDINYYIDRRCIKISNQIMQTLHTDDIMQLDDIGKSWKSLRDLQSDICDANIVYTIDCNPCICVDGHLVCTNNVCGQNINKRALRQEKLNQIESLPELKSVVGITCEPGKKYRYKCNTCLCTVDGIPSCTTMVCLEDFVLDLKALRGLLSSG